MFQRYIDKGKNILERLNAKTGGIPNIVIRAYQRFSHDWADYAVSSIAFYLIFSILPMLMFIVTIASRVVSDEVVIQIITTILSKNLPVYPEALAAEIEKLLSTSSTINFFALVGFIWSASSVFNSLSLTINRAWGVYNARTLIWSRVFGMIIIMFFVVLIIAILIFSLILYFISSTFASVPTQIILTLAPIAMRLLVFWGLYLWSPTLKVNKRAAFWAALVASLAWELLTKGYGWYLSTSWGSYELVYGSLGAILGLLFWIYLCCWILVYGAYLTEAIQNHLEPTISVEISPTAQ